MKAEDLMIGDWVSITEPDDFHGYTGKVRITNAEVNYIMVDIPDMHLHDVFIEDLQPIPLTEEILEKNGFGFLDTSNNEIKSVWTGWWILDGLELGCFSNLKFPVYFNISDVNVKVNYVHELQHALKLCGIEKEIVL